MDLMQNSSSSCEGDRRLEGRPTIRIWSFLALLAIASSCESWLKRRDVIDVVRFSRVFSGFGRSDPPEELMSEPYTFTRPCRELKCRVS